MFLFHRSNQGPDALVQVAQKWSSVHVLLSRLRNSRRYCAKDVPLLVWKQGQELHFKFHSPNDQMVEECVFTSEETGRILATLDKLPSSN